MLYLLSPKLAHRVVGYLEEEAIHSYTLYLNDIDRGEIENVPAPAIAIDYWRLPKDATLKDVITVIRADEAHHRDVNHFASVSIFCFRRSILNIIANFHILSWQFYLRFALCAKVINATDLVIAHAIQDIHYQGKKLQEAAAPIGYH